MTCLTAPLNSFPAFSFSLSHSHTLSLLFFFYTPFSILLGAKKAFFLFLFVSIIFPYFCPICTASSLSIITLPSYWRLKVCRPSSVSLSEMGKSLTIRNWQEEDERKDVKWDRESVSSSLSSATDCTFLVQEHKEKSAVEEANHI